MLDLDKIFADTPGKSEVIHLNNAGSSLMPQVVLDAQVDHLKLEARIGGYEAAAERAAAIEAVYGSVARLINCRPDEVAVVENATVGWMMGFYAIPFQEGDRILTAEAEYASNYLAYLQLAREKGVKVEAIPSTEEGEISLEALEAMIDERVRLISVTHVPTNGGLVNPVAAIGKIARKHDILYLVDACQSAGQVPLDVAEIGCDMLSVTARKYLRGPRGVGFLYVRDSLLQDLHPPMIDLRAARWTGRDSYELQPNALRFENWENNYAAKLGMGAAIDYALEQGLDNINQRVVDLADGFRRQLSKLDRVTVQDIGREKCGIVTFSVDGVAAENICKALRSKGINTSFSTPSSTLLDALRRDLPDVVRSSVHYFNDEAELEKAVGTLEEIIRHA